MIHSPRVCVQVQSVYIESQSSPEEERYVFALHRHHSQPGAESGSAAWPLLAHH